MVHARAGIIINTGEDNYLTTADAVDEAHTVTVSQLLNETLAKEAGPRGLAARPRPRLRDPARARGVVPPGAGARPAGPRALPRRAAEVDAADQAHDRRRLPRLPARRLLQPGRGAHRPGHPAGRDDDRGRRHPVAVRPRPRAAATSGTCWTRPATSPRTSRPRRAASSTARPTPCSARRSTCSAGSPTTPRACIAGDRRRHLRHHQAPGRRRQGPGRRRRAPARTPTTRRWSCWRRRAGPCLTASIVRPYGDTTGDGMVQTSFTLPVPAGPRAEGAALQLATKMGIEPAMVVHSHAIDTGYTFFVVYGSVKHLVDLDAVRRGGAGLPAAVVVGDQRRDPDRAATASWSSSAPASAPTRTPSASTRSSTSRASRGRRAWSTTARWR